ncbi:uncharacterized protein ASCRUDRAFT_116103 [Ascoidea rubescens DSM 1968]|uniref:Uncharacterized protein n=1 Tax=Ascoidea rubescens DSM 1968 TaxID=1344418 RepID=A0A1D2VBU9_9ASCO|nr:hypothetical protein ASCRUDRAFT_116103 [Ascoidea rubescens DSM 1968]ODV59085.1 hypothetical protein ASCRUDRAFT_116103 [Ascoidea rubescens DSM 1968]
MNMIRFVFRFYISQILFFMILVKTLGYLLKKPIIPWCSGKKPKLQKKEQIITKRIIRYDRKEER